MNVSSILEECRSHGVVVFLSDGGVAARGTREGLDKFKPILKMYRTGVIRYLSEHGANDLIREFIEVDGLTLAEAQTLAAVSVQPRPAGDWLALIAELDALINQYCAVTGLTGKAKAAISSTMCRQSLASIPDSLVWFRHELARTVDITPSSSA